MLLVAVFSFSSLIYNVDVFTKNINSKKFGIIPKYGIDNEYHEWREQSQGNYEFEFSYIIPFK